MFLATGASGGRAFLTLPWVGERPRLAWRAHLPREVWALRALPGLRVADAKAGPDRWPETLTTTATGERLSFGCAGPTEIVLFMHFQALNNSFRARQWGVNRNFERRKMSAG